MPSSLINPLKVFVEDPAESRRVSLCRYWAHQCRKMLDFEHGHPGQCFRIRYEDMATEPEKFLPGVFRFLAEEWEPSVLDFHRFQHDFGLQDDKILGADGFRARINTYQGWHPEELQQATAVASSTLRALGFDRRDR